MGALRRQNDSEPPDDPQMICLQVPDSPLEMLAAKAGWVPTGGRTTWSPRMICVQVPDSPLEVLASRAGRVLTHRRQDNDQASR